MATVRMAAPVWTAVHRHLFSTPGEHFAFLLARYSEGPDAPVLLVHDVILMSDEHVHCDAGGYRLTVPGYLEAINAAVRSGDALVEVHNHGGSMPRFSFTDRDELPDFVSYVLESLPGRPYAATVWGDDTIYGEWYRANGESGVIRSITVFDGQLRQLVSRDDDGLATSEIFGRQVPWFTEAGQSALGRLRVAIVGAGGTGSVLIQNLAYLGVRDFVVIDADAAEYTNMNRLVTAHHADLDTPKAVLARRLVRSVAPDAVVRIAPQRLPSGESIRLLKEADVIFGCVDNDGARFVLNELALAYGIPYLDLGVGIHVRQGSVNEIGGRVAIVLPGGPCLHCMRELDLEEVRHVLRSATEQTFAEGQGYVSGLEVTAPAVVSLNALVAAAAVNEFAMLVCGPRPPNVFTELDVLGRAQAVQAQWLTPRRVRRDEKCTECTVAGLGDRADVERFVRRMHLDDPVLPGVSTSTPTLVPHFQS